MLLCSTKELLWGLVEAPFVTCHWRSGSVWWHFPIRQRTEGRWWHLEGAAHRPVNGRTSEVAELQLWHRCIVLFIPTRVLSYSITTHMWILFSFFIQSSKASSEAQISPTNHDLKKHQPYTWDRVCIPVLYCTETEIGRSSNLKFSSFVSSCVWLFLFFLINCLVWWIFISF